MTKPIDLIELRKQIKEGILNVYLFRNKIYIEDVESGERIIICKLRVDEGLIVREQKEGEQE